MNYRLAMRAFSLLTVLSMMNVVQCSKSREARAVTTLVTGQVSVTYDGRKPIALNVGDEVRRGAVVTTEAMSSATIQLNEVGIVRIAENSRLELKSIIAENGATELKLESGAIFSRVLKRPGTEYRVQTPTLVASVRGTEFMVTSDWSRGGVFVREGTVAVSTPVDKTEKPVTVKKRAAVGSDGRAVVVPQVRVEELILEKHALQPYIENIETKKPAEIEKVFKKIEVEERAIDQKIEDIKLTALQKLKKQGKPLVRLFLRDGSQIIGSVEETTAAGLKLDTGESVIEIPKGDIRRRVPEQQ
ncbi:MAG: hypothetical protein EPN93_18595 [Spirochaetes bacterium]|nr:MAG: hypothetical protein EPN93_18595 [Spirochaetota bacterium]